MLTLIGLTFSLAFANPPNPKKMELKNTLVTTTANPGTPSNKSVDLDQFKQLSRGPVGAAGGGLKYSTSCKSRTGTEYKSGDAGYTGCLSESASGGSNRSKEGSTQSVNFQLGD